MRNVVQVFSTVIARNKILSTSLATMMKNWAEKSFLDTALIIFVLGDSK
jgi:hypothetical protein